MPDTTTSQCSASYAGCKRDTARMCCTAALLMQSAGRAAVDQCLCPPKQQAAVGGRANDGTLRQTDVRYLDPAPHTVDAHTPVQRPIVRDYPGELVPER